MPSVNEAYLNFYYEKTSVFNGAYDNALKITSRYNNNVIRIVIYDSSYQPYSPNDPEYLDIQYSLDNGMTWNDIEDDGTICTLSAGQAVLLKGTNNGTVIDRGEPDPEYYYRCIGSTYEYDVSGNPMSIIDEENFDKITNLSNLSNFNSLNSLFAHSQVVDASGLQLKATTLKASCYANMFAGCRILEKAPALPATTLAMNCYSGMFAGCDMALVTAPALPATLAVYGCYNTMFANCSSLTNAPILPATTLASSCYSGMFTNCTSLEVPPQLPATTVRDWCYYGMFKGCTSLDYAPELPATTLGVHCYDSMFEGCTSITKAPVLPATTLTSGCYDSMFKNCSQLNYIKILATSRQQDSLNNWVYHVASSGTFFKDPNATYLIDSNHGVPTGWTIHDIGQSELNEYNISVEAYPGGYGTVQGGGTYISNTRITVKAFPVTGKSFDGWYDREEFISIGTEATPLSRNQYYTFEVIENKSIIAYFTDAPTQRYSITLLQDPNVGATLTGAGNYLAGDPVTIHASYVHGYNFTGWKVNGNIVATSSNFTFTVTSDTTFTATYEVAGTVTTYTVTLVQQPITGALLQGGGTYAANASVPIYAPEVSGYSFVGWYANSATGELLSEENAYTFTITENVIICAVYEPTSPASYATITLEQQPNVGATLTGAGTYVKGEQAQLYAGNVNEYDFAGWYLNDTIVSNTQGYLFTVTGDATYVAKYDYHPYVPQCLLQFYKKIDGELTRYSNRIGGTVSVNNNELVVNTGTIYIGAMVDQGSTVSIKANPAENASFVRWLLDGEEYSTDTEIIVTVSTNMNFTAEFALDYDHTYFTIEPILMNDDNDNKDVYVLLFNYLQACSFEYRVNNGSTWDEVTREERPENSIIVISNLIFATIRNGYSVSLRNINITRSRGICPHIALYTGNNYFEQSGDYFNANFKVYGNIMSLLPAHYDSNTSTDNYYNGVNVTTLESGERFYMLLLGDSATAFLTDASNLKLPATTLSDSCYQQMFTNCRYLTKTPILPATTLGQGCYSGMFRGCTSLVNAPQLPATTLAPACYTGMFEGCTSIVNPPALPAVTLPYACYSMMFMGCTSIVDLSEFYLYAGSTGGYLGQNCYARMFEGCTSLTTPPQLPATSLPDRCYWKMFKGCTSLTITPNMGDPSSSPQINGINDRSCEEMFMDCTSLETAGNDLSVNYFNGHYCFYCMFMNCTSLVVPPTFNGGVYHYIGSDALPIGCYNSMFYNCQRLPSIVLPAPKLGNYSYNSMFEGCSRLTSVECLATDISADDCTLRWLADVKSTGTFYKAASMTDWTRDESGIPANWSVQNVS